ncbi:MAG TPA: MazG nucleotide pyrophosphohydrolase domain-containing protein [Planctomycetota bacterium]|nr:MazG nucleotide pyrophosphohydrolase domain-containing protein [Planctomycetota bacterium]
MSKLTVREFQEQIERIYGEKDGARGTAGTFMWLAEEVGELSRALRRGQRSQLEAEFADVLAWLATLASMQGVDLAEAAWGKYGRDCPRCQGTPCRCDDPHAGHGEPAPAASKPAARGGAARKPGRAPPP